MAETNSVKRGAWGVAKRCVAKYFLFVCVTVLSTCYELSAHPMPNSALLLTIHASRIDAEVQVPLYELQAAIGHAVNDSSAGLIERMGPQLKIYLAQHIRPQAPDGQPWDVSIGDLAVQETQNPINGIYRELTAQLRLVPPPGTDVRHFTLNYDVVLHQVMTHKILVSVRQDWATGKLAESQAVPAGIIQLDIVNNRILPLVINLESGSAWTGFRAMFKLGMEHIADGTDHLLFILTLLLPAPLLVTRGRWGRFGGVRYSLTRLLLIVSAFTLGHSLTLLAGSLGWFRLPGRPVEVMIALSILISAIHSVRPLFPGREPWIAAGFGLVHGLAFASTLANLQLDTWPMALSIFGFNLGIEWMQLLVIGLTIPWLLLLSRTAAYAYVRLAGAFLAAMAAIGWVVERITGRPNELSSAIESLVEFAPYLLAGLAILAVAVTWHIKHNRSISPKIQ